MDPQLRERLLRTFKFTLNKFIEISRAAEIIQQMFRVLYNNSSTDHFAEKIM